MNTTSAQRVREVLSRIAAATERSGRDPRGVQLVAVSKTQPPEAVLEVHQAGVDVFGENRIQEAIEKIPASPAVRWHFIGRLQRNKARRAIELFEMIHSIDSLRLADTVDRIGCEIGRRVEALIEVNVGGEESKGGIEPAEAVDFARQLAGREGLAIQGLMTIPPLVDDPELSRPGFQALAKLSREIAALGLPGVEMRHLSMGMSADFEVAIEEGATLVRVGTAVFGPRRAR